MDIQAVQGSQAALPLQSAAPVRAAEEKAAEAAPTARAPRYDRYEPGRPEEESAPVSAPAKAEGEETTTTINTDQVDREIAALKKELEQVRQQLRAAPEEQKDQLEREQARAELELSQKDNDAYRRQNAVVTQGTAGAAGLG